MHPVIEHILFRQNQNVSAEDGRKITLALFGGAMAAVRGAGALVALQELGLTNAFDEIYSMSSGFFNASYFLSEQMKIGAAAYYNELSSRKSFNIFRFWKIANIDYVLKVAREIRPLNVSKILSKKTKLYTMLQNISLGGLMEYLEVHNYEPEQYLDILKASSLLKFLTKGTAKIGNYKYCDIFYNSALNQFINKILSTNATDVLILYNYPWQQRYINAQYKNIDQTRICEVCLSEGSGGLEYLEKLTRFQTKSSKLKVDCQKAGDKIKHLFCDNNPIEIF